ncbi:MAG: hypothetical protein M1826_006628 [Phylliscum demangeonii]|nr:MAG: hypothetical protein M1826_006628 [Phylliscum demangeonii]
MAQTLKNIMTTDALNDEFTEDEISYLELISIAIRWVLHLSEAPNAPKSFEAAQVDDIKSWLEKKLDDSQLENLSDGMKTMAPGPGRSLPDWKLMHAGFLTLDALNVIIALAQPRL